MPLILPGNVGSATAATGYDVANSVRLNSGDSAVFKRTHGTPTNAKKFVWSAWIKRSILGADQYFVQNYTDSSNISMAYFRSGDDIRIFDRHGTGDGTDTVWISDAKFRDVSAWMHFLLKVDTTQSTDSNRFQVYINGSLATGNGITYPAQNADMNWTSASASNRHSIGATSDGYNYVGGYMCEVALVDGTSPAHTDFGEFNSDSPTIWQPKDVSGLTFGNNGYYLDFEDSGDLGDDESGNGNDFAETNLAATDQSTDTCTNNAITMNSLDHSATHNSTFSEGNLKVVTSASGSPPHFATFGLTTGKWYWEVKATSFTEHSAGYICIGITGNQSNSNTGQLGSLSGDYAFVNNGNIEAGTGNDTSYGNSYTQGQIIGTYLDLDNNKLYFSINGTLQNSGTGHSITAASSTTNGFYMPSFSDYSSSSSNLVTVEWNFGAGTTFAISSGNTDGEYGNFEYSTTITGDGASKTFKAINSKNLAEFG